MKVVMDYTKQDAKTIWQGQSLVSGINCTPLSVYDDFLSTKLLYHKDGGTLFYHMVQSHPKGAEVDPVTAHAAAMELAKYFDDYEVLICTHTDREHVHSHFIINSVSLEDGKKLHMSDQQIQELHQRNDQICMQFGLPVFQKGQRQKKVKSMSIAEYHIAAKGESWKFRLMNTIDDCMRYARTRDEFIALMKSEGYGVRWEDSRQNITYTIPSGMKCRDDRLHDERYLKEAMEHEFRIRQGLLDGRIEANEYATVYAAGTAPAAEGAGGSKYHGATADRPIYDAPEDAGKAGEHSEQHPIASKRHSAIPADAGNKGKPEATGDTERSVRLDGSDGRVQSEAARVRKENPVGDEGTDRTGWEDARQVFEYALRGGEDLRQGGWRADKQAPDADISDDPRIGGDFHSHQRSDLSASGSVGSNAPDSVAAGIVALGHALERSQDATPVNDATTKPTHHEHGKKRKLAPGQKADDHEDEQTWQQTMY